jgi:hypothetical protein
MSLLVWTMMAIAIWHFTVFVPDRFWGGIVGALLAAIVGAVVVGYVASGLSVPGRADTNLWQAFLAVPGTLLGLAAAYVYGERIERRG